MAPKKSSKAPAASVKTGSSRSDSQDASQDSGLGQMAKLFGDQMKKKVHSHLYPWNFILAFADCLHLRRPIDAT